MVKKAYSCTVTGCDKVFPMAFELKKHLALHKDPNSVYFCTECDFITLQKKNLGIHVAIHTGETPHHCPHILSVGPGIERCDFKTNDPAALTKHRKKVHAYVPLRGRKSAPAPFSKWKVLEGARRLRAPYKPPPEVAPYKPLSRSSDVANSTPDDPTPRLTKENVDARVDPPLSTDTFDIQSWLNSTDVYGRPMQADASGDHPTRQDPGPSSSLDMFGDHARDIWAETEAMLRSASLAPLDASAPLPWARTDAYPHSSSAASLLSIYGGDPSWAKTEAQMRSTSLDPVDMSTRHPWAEPDAGTSAHALHPWADPGACMPPTRPNVFRNHPGARTDAPRPSTSAVTLDPSGTRLPQPGSPTGRADAPAFDPMCNAYILTGASVAPKHGMDLNNIYDPTLCADWMAAYEHSYTHPGPTGDTQVVDPVEPSLVPGASTGREGCLCPEWMTEAGVEGWDQGVVDAHKDFYTF